jgi:hypothetical protein
MCLTIVGTQYTVNVAQSLAVGLITQAGYTHGVTMQPQDHDG